MVVDDAAQRDGKVKFMYSRTRVDNGMTRQGVVSVGSGCDLFEKVLAFVFPRRNKRQRLDSLKVEIFRRP